MALGDGQQGSRHSECKSVWRTSGRRPFWIMRSPGGLGGAVGGGGWDEAGALGAQSYDYFLSDSEKSAL